MPDTSTAWLLIDARGPWPEGVTPDTRVAGLSLLERHLRLAGRCGLPGVLIRTDDSDTGADTGADSDSEQSAAPAGLAIEYLRGPEPAPAARVTIPVSLLAVYTLASIREAAAGGPAPAPLATIAGRADLAAAERALFASVRKNVEQDGVFGYYTQRPLARPVVRLLIDTRVTPNQVTLSALVAGVIAALLASTGSYAAAAVAGVLFWLGAILDCIDGDLARLKLQGSKLGEWLDTLADDISTFGLLAGLCVGLLRTDQGHAWASFGLAAAALGALAQVKIYLDLHRRGGTIDTAQYPWFFGTPAGGASDRPRSALGSLVSGIAFLFRRDAVVTMIGALLLLDQRILAVAILAGGASVVVVLLAVHLLVTAARPARPH